MGRSPCCDDKLGLKKGPWTQEEDDKLISYIQNNGHGSWRALPKLAGLNRCGKSCRLRWTNYLRPDIKRGRFTEEEEDMIIKLHSVLGNKWSRIATHLEGRTDNEIKNHWNTHLRKKLLKMGIDPVTHKPRTDHHFNLLANLSQLISMPNIINPAAAMLNLNPPHPAAAAATNNFANNSLSNLDVNNYNTLIRTLQSDATQLAKLQVLQNIVHILNSNNTNINTPPPMTTLMGCNDNTNQFTAAGLLTGFPNVANTTTTTTPKVEDLMILSSQSNTNSLLDLEPMAVPTSSGPANQSYSYNGFVNSSWASSCGGGGESYSTVPVPEMEMQQQQQGCNSNNNQKKGTKTTDENTLPGLVSVSSNEGSMILYEDRDQTTASASNTTNSAHSLTAAGLLDGYIWEKLMVDDDGTSDFQWQDLLS